MARNKDDIEKRKRKEFPDFVTLEVMDDRSAWSIQVLRMEAWCRERVGVGCFTKQGRMGAERASLEFRFRSPDIAAEFQCVFGGTVGADEAKAPRTKRSIPRDLPAVEETLRLEDERSSSRETVRVAKRKSPRRKEVSAQAEPLAQENTTRDVKTDETINDGRPAPVGSPSDPCLPAAP